jgi:Peptidase S46
LVNGRAELRTVSDDKFLAKRGAADEALLAKVKADGHSADDFSTALSKLEQFIHVQRLAYPDYFYLESARAFNSVLFSYARDLVRLASESSKPDEERTRGYRNKDTPELIRNLTDESSIDKEFEIAKLSFSLRKFIEDDDIDGSIKTAVLGTQAPAQLAQLLVEQTTLVDARARKALLDGGAEAIKASNDAMIVFARDHVEPTARQFKLLYETVVDGSLFMHKWQISRVRRVFSTEPDYPDAIGALRLSYGRIEGRHFNNARLEALSSIGAMFAAPDARGRKVEPLASWVDARKNLDQATVITLLSSTDTIGGNSGSPVLDERGRVLAVMSGATGEPYYEFDPDDRSISVACKGAVHLLANVYHAERLVHELSEP